MVIMDALFEKTGPYRILKRLGAGGMGEVFLAYDDRLDRRVAIKRIRAGKGSDPGRQERFRREARMSAKLNHPAIVQVYDLLEEGDTYSIVMECVEGSNLRRLLEDGPLPIEDVILLARDIAEGLAEAHRQGIVHRDLKSENILVTPEGRAKIADFGIAKRLLKEKTEVSLTEAGRVLGTYRAMSPEQARGEEVDHRSDLFSLGVLLYEALAGHSPFEAGNELATLHRILHDRQAPLREVNPEVPPELSELVDHLLEKDPFLRPRSAGEVAGELRRMGLASSSGTATMYGAATVPILPKSPGTSGSEQVSREIYGRSPSPWRGFAIILLLVLASASAYVFFDKRSRTALKPQESLSVAVLRPEVRNLEKNPETGLLASNIRIALLQSLLSLKGISPRNFDEVDAVSGPATSVAKAVAADEVVGARLECGSDSCEVLLQRLQGSDGRILWAETFEVPADDFYMAANAASTQIEQGYGDYEPRRKGSEIKIDKSDLKRLKSGRT
jgi:serine/threonine protein kinase